MAYDIFKLWMNKELPLDPGNPLSYKYKKLPLAKMSARMIYRKETNPLFNGIVIRDLETKQIVFKIDKSGEK